MEDERNRRAGRWGEGLRNAASGHCLASVLMNPPQLQWTARDPNMIRTTRPVSIPAGRTNRSQSVTIKEKKGGGGSWRWEGGYMWGCGRVEIEVDMMKIYCLHVWSCKNKWKIKKWKKKEGKKQNRIASTLFFALYWNLPKGNPLGYYDDNISLKKSLLFAKFVVK